MYLEKGTKNAEARNQRSPPQPRTGARYDINSLEPAWANACSGASGSRRLLHLRRYSDGTTARTRGRGAHAFAAWRSGLGRLTSVWHEHRCGRRPGRARFVRCAGGGTTTRRRRIRRYHGSHAGGARRAAAGAVDPEVLHDLAGPGWGPHRIRVANAQTTTPRA